ncbi:MAG: hypothetical protein ACK4ML_03540 [Alishewanella aestuarii]
MPDSAGARRPYLQPLSRSWWLKHGFFLRYMLREATVLPLLFSVAVYWQAYIAWLRGKVSIKAGWRLWRSPGLSR